MLKIITNANPLSGPSWGAAAFCLVGVPCLVWNPISRGDSQFQAKCLRPIDNAVRFAPDFKGPGRPSADSKPRRAEDPPIGAGYGGIFGIILILHTESIWGKSNNYCNFQPRGMSMFLRIPETRNCSAAHIPRHWCACLTYQPIPLDNPDLQGAALALVEHVNEKFLNPHPQCRQLTLVFMILECDRFKVQSIFNFLNGIILIEIPPKLFTIVNAYVNRLDVSFSF